MDKKCENCGQFISENDRFCKYCGCPAPHNSNVEKPKKETVRSLEDKIQRRKTEITETDFDGAGVLELEKIEIKFLGQKSQLKVKSLAAIIVAFIAALAAIVGFIIVSPLEFKFVYGKVLLLFVFVAIVLVCVTVILERAYNIKGLNETGEGAIYIKRAGFAHDALFCKGDSVYKLSVNGGCELCDGEIKGDLHIERIENRFIAVCNYNRRHFWIVDPDEIYVALGGVSQPKSAAESEEKAEEKSNEDFSDENRD